MRTPRFNSRLPGGFTLIEMVTSLLMLAILLVAVEASLVASTKAIPDKKSLTGAISTGASAANRLSGELAYALTVTEMGASAITFTVPDRNGDGTPETIRYAWSGIAGDPLTRQYNGAAAGSIVASIQDFQLQYDKTSQSYYPTIEGAETLVFSYTNTLLAQNVDVSATSYPGEYFVPSLPNGTISWRVTRVKLRAHDNSSPDGIAQVQLRTATPAGTPTNRVLDQATMVENTLGSSATWVEYAFSANSGLDPNAGFCIVIPYVSGSGDCGQVQKNTLSLFSSSIFIKSLTTGNSWNTSGLDSLLLYVYGKPTRQDTVAYKYYLPSVRLSLRTTSNSQSAVATTVKLLNLPQVTGP
jgi:prepilin-type N-terminal cleavage/methylation domain-containing protein